MMVHQRYTAPSAEVVELRSEGALLTNSIFNGDNNQSPFDGGEEGF